MKIKTLTADAALYRALHACPCCGARVGQEHFACQSGRMGGLVGGRSRKNKKRGDGAYYRALAKKRKARQA